MTNTFDPRPQFLSALDQLEKLAGTVTPEQLDRPTPCTEYDLRVLLGHTVGAAHRIAYTGEGGRPLDVPAGVGKIEDGDWAGAVARVRARAAAAWAADEKLDRMVEMPWGEVPGRIGLGGYLMEIVAHSWDVARTTGQQDALDEELSQVALELARQILPAEPRGGFIPFAAVQPAPAGATPSTQLAAWLGRTV